MKRQLPRKIFRLVLLLPVLLLVDDFQLASAQQNAKTQQKAKTKRKAKAAQWPRAESIDPSGRPKGQLNDQPARIYVFRDGRGWNIVTTYRKRKPLVNFSGTITVENGTIKAAVPYGKESKQDVVKIAASKRQLTFKHRTGGLADAFYFVVSADVTRIRFDLKPAGNDPRQRVFIGKGKVQPKRLPFVLKLER